MKKLLLIITLFLESIFVQAQNVTAYLDYRGLLQCFDRGLIRQLEYIPMTNYKIGGNTIAWIDNKNDFRIYYNGQTYNMLNAADFSYFMSDHLTAFKVANVLYVFDEGEKKILTYYNSDFSLGDSVIAYFDDARSTLNFYYKGKSAVAEENFLGKPRALKTGPNIISWINQSGYFNIFYHGKNIQLDYIPPVAFEVGRDIVAWIDDYTRQFHLFYNGDTATVETFAPDSFKLGFGIMAYVDQQQNFRVFYDGRVERLLSNVPEYYGVKGNTVAYIYNNTFFAFYRGDVYTLQNARPISFKIGNEGVAWIDESGRLKLFHKGKIYDVSYEIINKYALNGNVLKYEVGTNTVYVFYEGKNY